MPTTTIRTRLENHLVSLARRRASGTVTSDDAQRVLDRWNYRGNRNLIGGILRNFDSVGYTRSTRPSNKSRTVRVWAI